MPPVGVMFLLLPVCCLLPGASRAATASGQYAVLGPRVFGAVSNFSAFLLDPASGVLFLGARDAIVALDTNKLNEPPRTVIWDVPQESRNICMTKGKTEGDCRNYILLLEFHSDGRHIYACGTYAFDPKCAFLEISSLALRKDAKGRVAMEMGRKKVPFDPRKPFTAVMTGDALYAATSINFRGTEFDIARATGPEQRQIRSEQKVHWLDEPEFVSSAVVELSADDDATGEDDRIYFFFNEAAMEYNFYSKVRVPRVARVCKSDVGGLRTLQQHWTTFLKAELVCEDKLRHQRYDTLLDVFTLRHSPREAGSTHFYGLFTTQREPEQSAVCVFSVSDIIRAMNGPFKKRNDKTDTPTPVGSPRPGQCLNNALKAEGFDSSLKIPDNLLAYVRNHPLVQQSVTAAPLLVRKGVTYTKLAVTLIGRKEGQREAMLHLGTDDGELHQVAVMGENATLLREVPLFQPTEPVIHISLHQRWAVVGSPLALARIRSEECALYLSCKLCARFRELGCEWDASEERCLRSTAAPGNGDVIEEACVTQEERCAPPITELRVSLGLRLLLPCAQLSPRLCSWQRPANSLTKLRHPDLEVTVTKDGLGTYICACQEGPIHDPAPCRRAAYQLTLEDPTTAGAVAGCARHVLAFYVLFFFGGLLFGATLLLFVERRHASGRRDSARSPAAPRPGFCLTDKRNGIAAVGADASRVRKRGDGSHHGNSGNGTTACDKARNGSGNAKYANYNVLSVDVLDERTARREVGGREAGGRESVEGAEAGEGLGGPEEEFASFPMFTSPAPLAPCEESSI
ncbi:semaphorin-4F [Phycodurus eques]|uniref:semaphorin-4F n=1 Tax=Phycodurus eques TaxID=693459 RepID=UPI002ACDB9A1|nr:semaphorin-4F [Phycodurus eques]XP_061525430.1 semaphorin-4F [Phycodurus eques]